MKIEKFNSSRSSRGGNLALADAVDLAEALASSEEDAVRTFEEAMAARAEEAARGAVIGLNSALSSYGAAPVLAHYQQRLAA